MKKNILIIALLLFSVSTVVAKEEDKLNNEEVKYGWKYSGDIGLNFTQASFKNWALGGEGSVGGVGLLKIGADYIQDKYYFNSSFDSKYGLQKIDGQQIRKNTDEFRINSKLGYNMSSEWSVAILIELSSQFDVGYEYDKKNIYSMKKISNFFAPGYGMTAIGFDYKPNGWFSLFISPTQVKHTFVIDNDLSKQGLFGVKKGDKYISELGSVVAAKFHKDVIKNVNLLTTLNLFSAYRSFNHIDIKWDLTLSMKVNKYISANINTSLIYDDDVIAKVQFKEVIGVGFAYKFGK